MKLIRPSYEIVKTTPTSQLKDIEQAARTCYKSEDKISEDDSSAIKLFRNLVDRKHKAMLEFGENFVFLLSEHEDRSFFYSIKNFLVGVDEIDDDVMAPNYLNFSTSKERTLVSGSLRVFRDIASRYPNTETSRKIKATLYSINPLFIWGVLTSEDDLDKKTFPLVDCFTKEELIIHKTLTVKFICDRGVSHELVRHRPCSFAQESTRYCNYSKNKFGNEITYIIPDWIKEEQIELVQKMNEQNFMKIDQGVSTWYASLLESEQAYNMLTKLEWQPQMSRSVLPNSLKTEVNVKATLLEWQHIFGQRAATAAHSQMRELMIPLLEEVSIIHPEIFLA